MDATEQPIIDTTVLDRLTVDVGGDRSIVLAVVETYLGELDRRYGAIALAHQQSDLPKLEAAAHELGSASIIIGVTSVATRARALEAAAAAGDREACAPLLNEVAKSLPDARVALADW
jgi:hypothetical protein